MLRNVLAFRRGYRPELRDGRFLDSLIANSRAFAEFHRRSGHRGLESVAHFFRKRSHPKFFAGREEITLAVEKIQKEHPTWRDRTLERLRTDREEGLGVYAREGPPMRPGFPWGRLEGGPGRDKLYRKRPHRFAFAPRLALAALYGEPTDGFLHELLTDWMSYASRRDNALAYDSNLAVIQRLLALSWAWAFLSSRHDANSKRLLL